MIEALRTWRLLNEAMHSADEKLCAQMLSEELSTQRRVQFVLRIHSRYNFLRAARERVELTAKCNGGK